MRIGIFTDTYVPFINGVTTSVLMLKKALEKKGHTVYIVTVNAENMQYQFEENGKVIRIPGVPIGIYDYRLTGIYPLRAIKIIKKWNLDIIHSQTEFGIGTFARIISKQLSIPLVHTYHTMYEDYVHYITHGYFNRSSKKIVEYLTLFYCDKTISELVVPTKKAYELFKKKYKVDRNVYIVPTGIDVEKFYIEENKNVNKLAVRLILSSMKSISRTHSKIKLLIVGDGPDLEKYKNYTTKNNIQNNVVFAGKVPWDKINEYYTIADCFATASTSETQGLTVIEAMAASLPVVCINDESFTETVIDNLNGLVFKNRREYKKAIIKLYEDKELQAKLSSQARISAEIHSSKYFAEQILDVYRIAMKGYEKSKFPIIKKIKDLFNKEEE